MERAKVEIDKLKQWKVKLEIEHKKWKDKLETEQYKLNSDCQLQYLSHRESKDGYS